MKYFFVFCLMLVVMRASAQSNPYPPIVWDKDYGGNYDDILIKIVGTSDGGALLCGYSNSDPSPDISQATYGSYDYWVERVDADGNKLWDKRYGGSDDDILTDALATWDGGFILAGSSYSNGSGSKSQNTWGDTDYWIVKIDGNGNQIWDSDFGGSDYDQLTSIAQTADGGFVLGGHSLSGISGNKTQPSWGGSEDYWIIKVNAAGSYQWDKRFGGTGDDYLSSVEQTPDGGYLSAGYSDSDSSGDKTQNSWSSRDYWIVRTDSLGSKLWDKRIGSTYGDQAEKALLASDGGFFVVGESSGGISGDKTSPNISQLDDWLVHCDASGSLLWDSTYGGYGNEELAGNGEFAHTLQGGLFFAGTSYSYAGASKSENNLGYEQGWIVVTDSLGQKLWDKTILTTGHDEFCTASQSVNGCFWLGVSTDAGIGGNKTQAGYGDKDFFVMKLCDTTMLFLPPTAVVQPFVTKICPEQCTSFGNSSNNATSFEWFFPGANPSYSTAQFPTNICYSTSGLYSVTLIAHNGPYADTATAVNLIEVYPSPAPTITQSNDTLYCTSALTGLSYQWSLNGNIIGGATNYFYVPSANGTYTVQATSNDCAGSASLLVNGLGVTEPSAGAGFSLYPNPADETMTVALSGQKPATVKLYNALGQLVRSSVVVKTQTFDLSDLPGGVYCIAVQNENESRAAKLVVSHR